MYTTQFQNGYFPMWDLDITAYCVIVKLLECLVSRIDLFVLLSLRTWASGWDKDSLRGSVIIL